MVTGSSVLKTVGPTRNPDASAGNDTVTPCRVDATASVAASCPHRQLAATEAVASTRHGVTVSLPAEASGFLVGPTVFKTDEPVTIRLAGSIPVRLRY